MKKNIILFFRIYKAAFALTSSDTRCEGKKNIPRKFLFGFPDDQPWHCVIMAGLLHGVQSFSAGPGTMGTVWSSVCGLRLLLMKETRQQLPSWKLLRYNRLRSHGNMNHQQAFHLFRVAKPLVSAVTLHSTRIGNELCPKINLPVSAEMFSFKIKQLDVKISRPTVQFFRMWQTSLARFGLHTAALKVKVTALEGCIFQAIMGWASPKQAN